MKTGDDQAKAGPGVEPAVDEPEFGLVSVDEYRGECGPEATAGLV